jgi:molybdopterin converting factor subunit 1
MTVRVLLFAAARDAAGANEVELRLPGGATFRDLRDGLTSAYPRMAEIAARARFAAKERYVSDSDVVPEAVEIALIPPVSGG